MTTPATPSHLRPLDDPSRHQVQATEADHAAAVAVYSSTPHTLQREGRDICFAVEDLRPALALALATARSDAHAAARSQQADEVIALRAHAENDDAGQMGPGIRFALQALGLMGDAQ